MPADSSIYASERVGLAYASSRPAIHGAIVDRALAGASANAPLHLAIDAGCGAGLSTLPLLARAKRVVGVDPYDAMIKHAPALVPGALFVRGRLESLPFASHCADLATTAGALNYCDAAAAMAELARVLVVDGLALAYDFSAGQRLSTRSDLPSRFAAFKSAFPAGGGYALDLRALPAHQLGLELVRYEQFVVSLPMSSESYLRYVLSESGVELALSRGTDPDEVRATCEALFGSVFQKHDETVEFDALFAAWRKVA